MLPRLILGKVNFLMEDQYLLHSNAHCIIDLIFDEFCNHIPFLVNEYDVYVILQYLLHYISYCIIDVLDYISIAPKSHKNPSHRSPRCSNKLQRDQETIRLILTC